MLLEQIDSDLKEALKSKNSVQADCLRMLKSRIKNEEIAKQKVFSDEELQTIIFSEIKKRKDSVQAFLKGNRKELADKEQQEITYLQKYLPEQFSEEEVAAVINEKLSGQNFTAADFGKAMGLVMPALRGKADGEIVSRLLKAKLNG